MKRFPLWLRVLLRLVLAILLFWSFMQLGRFMSGATSEPYYEEEITQEKTIESQDTKAQKESEKEITPKEKNIPIEEKPKVIEKQDSAIDSTHILSQKNVYMAKKMDYLLRTFKPAHALYLMVDAKTNEIIAWGESKDQVVQASPDYLSRSTFPAASLIKTVTLAAALESKQYSLNTKIPLIGNPHTLYKSQIKQSKNYKGETTYGN